MARPTCLALEREDKACGFCNVKKTHSVSPTVPLADYLAALDISFCNPESAFRSVFPGGYVSCVKSQLLLELGFIIMIGPGSRKGHLIEKIVSNRAICYSASKKVLEGPVLPDWQLESSIGI